MASSKSYSSGSMEPPSAPSGVLRLYSMRFCPYATRIRLILEVKHVSHEILNIDLKKKPEWFLAKFPEGKVPAVEIGNRIIYGSLTIADYLDSAYPEPRLWSLDPLSTAEGKILIEKLAMLETMCANCYNGREALVWEKVTRELNFYEDALSKHQTTYFSGDQLGMVDYIIWPIMELVEILWMMDNNKTPLFSVQFNPLLTIWRENLLNNEVIKRTCTDMKTAVEFYRTFRNGSPNFDIELN